MYQEFELSKPIEGKEEVVVMPDETNIYTITSGTGEVTVVLAHGYGFHHMEWTIIVKGLNKRGYRTIVFDQRGHGKSTIGSEGISSTTMASDYKNLIHHFNLKSSILVGHSMGGFLAMKFLATNPEVQHTKIKSCVLMATFAGNVNKQNFQNRLQMPMIKYGILQRVIKWKPIGRAFVRSILGDESDPEVIRSFLEMFLAQDHKKLLPILKAFARESYYDTLKNITIPCAVVIGSKDKTTPSFHTDDIVNKIPNASRIVIKGKGHCLNVEAPMDIIDTIVTMDHETMPL